MSSEHRARAAFAASRASASEAAANAPAVHIDTADLPPRPYFEEAFDQTVDRIVADIPWIMHGSGDVAPHEVDASATHFLASLTTQYMTKLVDAAVDTYTMFLNQDGPLRVPPPPFEQHRLPAKPRPLVNREPPPSAIIMKGNNHNERQPPRKKPKRKMRQEYWDDPLPAPKIRKKDEKTDSDNKNSTKEDKDDDNNNSKSKSNNVPIEEWVGAIGVDLHSDSIRRAHMPMGLSAPNFVFPICHDVYAYGRVRHIQAAKRASVDPLLQDNYLRDVLQEEKLSRFKKPPKGAGAKNDDDDDDDDADQVNDPPSWPDIDALLLPGFHPDLGFAE